MLTKIFKWQRHIRAEGGISDAEILVGGDREAPEPTEANLVDKKMGPLDSREVEDGRAHRIKKSNEVPVGEESPRS